MPLGSAGTGFRFVLVPQYACSMATLTVYLTCLPCPALPKTVHPLVKALNKDKNDHILAGPKNRPWCDSDGEYFALNMSGKGQIEHSSQISYNQYFKYQQCFYNIGVLITAPSF